MKTRAVVFTLIVLAMTGRAFADLKIGLMPADNSIPLVVAEKKGLFEAAGVKVELVPFTGQLERETALQTGAIDGTVSDLINAIQAWSRGFAVQVTSVTEGDFSLLSSPKSALRTISDWKSGSRAKVSTGLLENSIVYYLSERMLSAAGADPSRIDLVPIVALPTRLEMLLAEKIEAACLPEPLATLAESRGAHRLAESDGMGTTPGVLLFTKKALTEKSADIRAVYTAYNAAVDEVNAHPEAYRQTIVTRCDFPPAVATILRIPRFQHAFLTSVAQFSDVALWMTQKGLVSKAPAYSDVIAAGYAAAHVAGQ